MRPQSQIQRTLGRPESVAKVKALLEEERFSSRTQVGRRVCEVFDFRDRLGRLQLSSCLVALRAIERRCDSLVLPAAGPPVPRSGQPRLLDEDVRLAASVPDHLGQVRDLRIEAVSSPRQRQVWNTLIANQHPQGMTTFAGAQVRYLVHSAHGWLAALGFSAAALRLAAREEWIGWSDEQRRAHLDKLACLSRFLIGGGCANLASHVLGRVLRRLPGDFRRRYGHSPWLVETLVELRQDGASLRAANFVWVGQTAGRGRQDRYNRRQAGVKAIYVYELRRDWRRQLGVAWVDRWRRLGPAEGLDSARWARNEFGGAQLGDKRLTRRLVRSAQLLGERPGRPIAGSQGSGAAEVDGYYRFIERPGPKEGQARGVTVERILAPHRERSVRRMQAQKEVLCIQDGSDLRFATRPGCRGLEVIGRNQTKSRTRGLHLHLTLAVTGTGLPLGVLRCGFGTPGKSQGGKSRRWIDGYRDIASAASKLTRGTRVIAVMDREADFWQLFDEQRRDGRVEILVRARHDRRLAKGPGGKLFGQLGGGPADGYVNVEVPGLTARPKSSRKRARAARLRRRAGCEVRYREVTLPATKSGGEPAVLRGVHVRETAPPAGEKGLEWHLLTSLEVSSCREAEAVVSRYRQRWKVEDFFRVLKSGCKVQDQLFRTAKRLQRAVAIQSVIAWRIMVLTLLGREVPECSADVLFAREELDFLRAYAGQQGRPGPADLGSAVALVAHLGGYRGRKHDPPPGNQIMWEGYNGLTIATMGYMVRDSELAAEASG